MKKDPMYKKMKKAILKYFKKYDETFEDTYFALAKNRYTIRMIDYICRRSLDTSYPKTNMGIPFYFYEGYAIFELIDKVNPLNNLLMSINAWGDNSTKGDNDKYDDGRISVSSNDFWTIGSWLQYSESGRVHNSPPNLDYSFYRMIPEHTEYGIKELSYYAKIFSEYLRDTNIEVHTKDEPAYIEQLFSFKNFYIVSDKDKSDKGYRNVLYGVAGNRIESRFYIKKRKNPNLRPYFILLRDPELYKHKGSNGYNCVRSIFLKDLESLNRFIDFLDEDVRDGFRLMLAVHNII